MVTSRPKVLLMDLSGPLLLLKLGSVYMPIAHVTTGAHVNHVLKDKSYAELAPPLTALGKSSPLKRELTLPLAGPGVADHDGPSV